MSLTAKYVIFGLLFGTLIYVFSPGFSGLMSADNIWKVKEELLYLTGSIALSYMVISMVTSLRIGYVNNKLGGLDKAYIVHKWAGIWALSFSVVHYLLENMPKWLVKLEIITRPARKKGISPYSDFAKELYKFGNDIVEIAFYIIVIVLIIALLKRIPYNIFRVVHKIIPILFLAIAYHSFTIQIKGLWFGSIGSFILSAVIFIGVIAAILDLFQPVKIRRKYKTDVKNAAYDEKTGILDITLSVKDGGFNYKAGQYVFLTFPKCSSEPHPFSIASYGESGGDIRFYIKALGDWTEKLCKTVQAGDFAIMEGPYGAFSFNDNAENQVWIAAGIGVTPFISRLEELSSYGKNDKTIDFFYSFRGDCPLKDDIEKLCEKAGVRFHLRDTSKNGRLSFDDIKNSVINIDGASFWFCGPESFGRNIGRFLKENNIKISRLHFDSFDMR